VIDLSDGFAPIRAMRHMTVSALPDIRRGMAWRSRLSQAGVPWIAASDIRAEGEAALRAISFRTRFGWQTKDADTLLLHDGVIPSVQMTRALGCAHEWNEAQRCWQPVVDDRGRTSIANVLVAGDGAGVGGASAAVISGRIAALGLVNGDPTTLRAEYARTTAARSFLDVLFAPRPMHLDDATVVCRCEEVTAAAIRHAARSGCQGMNQLKAYTRCGMGPCQGRMCGPIAIEVLAEASGVPIATVEPLRARFPIKPVSVGALTSL
jgi:bacterioferritin-associated ferredoxin